MEGMNWGSFLGSGNPEGHWYAELEGGWRPLVFGPGGARRFEFEEVYLGQLGGRWDAWRSRDFRQLRLRLVVELLRDWNFSRVLDVGCGVGNSTQFLKRSNNHVLGVDGSAAAIAQARMSFPDIEFAVGGYSDGEFDLVSFQGVLAYVAGWSELLARPTRYCVVGEYVPTPTHGCVGSIGDLVSVFTDYYRVIHRLVLDDEVVVLFGERR